MGFLLPVSTTCSPSWHWASPVIGKKYVGWITIFCTDCLKAFCFHHWWQLVWMFSLTLKPLYQISNVTCWPRSVLLGFLLTSSHLALLNCHEAVVVVLPSGVWCHGGLILVLCICGLKRQPFLKYRVKKSFIGYVMPLSYLNLYQSLIYWEKLAFGPESGVWKQPLELGRCKKGGCSGIKI